MKGAILRFSKKNRELESKLSVTHKIDRLTARLLLNRGITEPEEVASFLTAPLSALHDPDLIPGLKTSAGRIVSAIEEKQKIVVYGDYDVDGITGSALLLRFLRDVGANADCYLPDREKEGYGLNVHAVEKIARVGCKLLVTVDNGVSAVEETKRANELGLDVIITDHHLKQGDSLPEAFAIANLHVDSGQYPYNYLCGAGIAFKLCSSVRRELHRRGAPKESLPNLKRNLDLVALATVADCVPLTGENRIVVRHGLAEIENTDNPGLAALKKNAGAGTKITSEQIAFGLAPRINAAGRLACPKIAFDLLLTHEKRVAVKLAGELEEINKKRREIQSDILTSAIKVAEETFDPESDRALVLGHDSWSQGVIGIVAAGLVERYGVPVAIVGFDGDTGRGSVRGLPGFDCSAALAEISECLKGFGGHKMAAGFALRKEDYSRMKERFLAVCSRLLENVDTRPVLEIDDEIDPTLFNMEKYNAIEPLAPFGEGNRAPLFLGKSVDFTDVRYIGKDGSTIRLDLAGGASMVGFSLGSRVRKSGAITFDVVYTPELNHFNGNSRLQLRIVDIVS